jgi:hypothetical protein
VPGASRFEQILDIARSMNNADDFGAVLGWAIENQMVRKPFHPEHSGLGKKGVAIGDGPSDARLPGDEPTSLFGGTVESPRCADS